MKSILLEDQAEKKSVLVLQLFELKNQEDLHLNIFFIFMQIYIDLMYCFLSFILFFHL